MANISLTPAMRTNLLSLQGTAQLMSTTQNRISTGLKVGSALDNPTAFFTAKGLSNSAADLATLKDSMGQGISTIQSADKALVSIQALVDQMKGITASAKAASTTAERSNLATQFDDLRGQIDALASDATYNGKNLVNGRGTITGGTFTDTTAATVSDLSGVSAGGIVRTGTSTDVGTFTISTTKKVNTLATTLTVTADNGNVAEVFINGASVGSATGTAAAGSTGDAVAALSSLITSDGAGGLTVAAGNVIEIRDPAGATFGGLAAGLQNDATGAQVKNLTSALGIYGAEVYANVSGYTANQTDTNLVFTVSADKATLTVTDAVGGTSATIATSSFATGGTDTLAIGDLNVNFVTSLATENTNAAPAVANTATAQAQTGTLTLASDPVAEVSTMTVSSLNQAAGDVISVNINAAGAQTYTILSQDLTADGLGGGGAGTASQIANNIAAKVAAAVTTGVSSVASTDGSGLITITASAVNTPLTFVNSWTTDTGGVNATANATQTVAASADGGYDSGDAFGVVVNGTTYTSSLSANKATRELAATEVLSDLQATTLEADNDVTLSLVGNVITATSNTSGKSFTLTASQTVGATGAQAMTAAAGTSNIAQANTITIAGNIDDGDVFSATVNGTTVTYMATTADVTAGTAVDNIAAGLMAAINASTTLVNGASGLLNTSSSVTNNVLTLTENSQGTVLAITSTGVDAAVSFGNESKLTSTQDLKSMTTGTADGDVRLNVTSGGVTQAVDISTSNTTAVTISNAAFGSTFSITADDSTMIAGETSTITVSNATGSGANDMKVNFNNDSTAFVNTQAVTASATGLGVAASTNSFAADSDIDSAIANLTSATTSLRTSSQSLATNLGIIQTRENFTAEFINVLQAGSDKLTLADTNQEAANMLALQTRQQLGIQSLSMASQAAQSVLGLFR